MASQYKPKFDARRKWGVEIELISPVSSYELSRLINEAGVSCEVESYNHARRGHWKITTDASVHANRAQMRRRNSNEMELVSPPLKGEEGFRQLKIVCDVLEAVNADVNKTCGLHVHHDMPEYRNNYDDMGVIAARLYDAYAEYEGVIDRLMPGSRRGNSNTYCRGHRGYEHNYNPKATKVGFTSSGRKLTLRESKSVYSYNVASWTRYVKVNLDALERHGTIEFRHHSGTVEFAKIKNWIVFTQLFLLKATNTTLRERKRARNLKHLVDWLRIDRDTPFHGQTDNTRDEHAKECAAYLRDRYAHFATIEGWDVKTAW